MKEKFLNALKTKYKNLGLSDKAFDGVAEFYLKTITEESQIEAKVLEAEALIKAVQVEADRVRTDSTVKKTELEKKIEELKVELEKKVNPKPNPDGGADGDDAELKALKGVVDQLQNKLTTADKAALKQANLEKARAIMLEKGVDEKLCDKALSLATVNYAEADTPESIAERGVNEYNDLSSVLNTGAGDPNASVGGGIGDEEISDLFAKKKAENEARAEELKNLN